MEWLGRAKIEFTHADSPRVIETKNGEQTDLLKICEKITPPCNLNPLLFNGHIQTMWTATKPSGPAIYYRRRVFEADQEAYQGSFAVDFAVEPFEDSDPTLSRRVVYYTEEEFANISSDDSKPMLVVLHGLSGGSHEIYLRHAIAPLIENGWEVCVVNSRGCAKSKITSGLLYNARATWDIRQTVKWLRKTFPNRPLFGLGFSLGANMLTNYCGEEGDSCELKGAIACSNPFNLDVTSKMMQSSFFSREVYLRVMGMALKELAKTHEKELREMSNIDMDSLENCTYVHEFDRAVQCPIWGYPTETAYYRDASSVDAILAIKIPFLAIHATDDPIALKDALPYQEFRQNPNTVLITTSLGGHLCWFETGGTRWHTRPICNFFNYMASEVNLKKVHADKDTNGFTKKNTSNNHYTPMRRKLHSELSN